MPGDGPAKDDPFRAWLEASRAFLESGAMPDALTQRCAALFAAWGRFAAAYAEASATAVGGPAGGPFDPVSWIDAGGPGGFGDLWQWIEAPLGASGGAALFGAGPGGLRETAEWLAYSAALARYRAVLAGAWLAAFGRFTEAMAGRGAAPDWTTILDTWQRTAEAELDRAQRSEPFLDAQREVIRTRLACSALLRGRIEELARLLDLPTRAEIDDLHEAVHALRREIRSLRAGGQG